jgi:hypothetical protein
MRTRLGTAFAIGFGGLLASLSFACSDMASDCENTLDCEPYDGGSGSGGASGQGGISGQGGSSGQGGAGAAGGSAGDGGCDASSSPGENACVISNDFGVFVSAKDGDDTAGDGTREKPYKTIGKGLTSAKAAGKKTYVCATGGGYAENITIDGALDGSELYGGFDCDTWSYSTSVKALIDKPSAMPFKVNGVNALVIENVEVQAATATGAGASSIAMIAADSQNVVLRRVKLVAGDGADGAPGTNGQKGADGPEAGADQKGKDACSAAPTGSQLGGGWPGAVCGSEGGAGGAAYKNVTTPGGAGIDGSPKTNVNPPNVANGGAGATVVLTPGSPGQPGSPGNAGVNGPAAASVGAFKSAGYTAADGNAGASDGFPGQGGGGGGAAMGNGTCVGASGGAGGMGGCGGTKATGGGGGGASVALFSWSSSVTLDSCELISNTGGAGGKGGDAGQGGGGKTGGTKGLGGGLGDGGGGGDGGSGGPGGSGSGGTGGPSFALVWQGTAPTKIGSVNLTPGGGGQKGIGGAVQIVAINKAPDGSDGATGQEHEQQ